MAAVLRPKPIPRPIKLLLRSPYRLNLLNLPSSRAKRKMADSAPLDDSQIGRIIQNVMRELGDADSAPITRRGAPAPIPRPIAGKGDGMFHDPDSAVAAAREAAEQLSEMPLDVRKHMIEAMRATAREHAGVLAQFAVEETGMGRVEDKTQKNLLTANKTPGPEYLEPHVWTGDDGL